MAFYRTKRGAFYMGPESSWGAGALALTYLKTKEVTIPPGMEYLDADDITQKDLEDLGDVMYQPGDIAFKMGLHPVKSSTWPTAKPLIGSVPPISIPLGALMGGTKAGGYGVTTTGNTSTVLQFDPYAPGGKPTELGFVEGEGIFVRNSAAANVLGFNAIKDVDDVNFQVTLRHPLPATPGDAAIAYGGYSWPKLPTASTSSWEAVWEGEAATDRRQCLACVPSSAMIEAPHRGKGLFSMGLRSARPVPLALAESGAAPATEAYAYPDAAQVLFGGLYIWNGSALLKLSGGTTIDFGVETSEVGGINGLDPNGVQAYIMTARKIRVKLTPSYTDNTIYSYFESPPATYMVTGWWGRGARVWGFQVPAALMVGPAAFVDRDGVVGQDLEFGCGAYTGDTGTGGDTDAGDKPFVLSVLAG